MGHPRRRLLPLVELPEHGAAGIIAALRKMLDDRQRRFFIVFVRQVAHKRCRRASLDRRQPDQIEHRDPPHGAAG
jgi:hypothetical protein